MAGVPAGAGQPHGLYLVDVSDRNFKIAVVAPANRFAAVVADSAPIVDSIQFAAPIESDGM
jgi:hypothetical protein